MAEQNLRHEVRNAKQEMLRTKDGASPETKVAWNPTEKQPTQAPNAGQLLARSEPTAHECNIASEKHLEVGG